LLSDNTAAVASAAASSRRAALVISLVTTRLDTLFIYVIGLIDLLLEEISIEDVEVR
jgi:hypothetical protein